MAGEIKKRLGGDTKPNDAEKAAHVQIGKAKPVKSDGGCKC